MSNAVLLYLPPEGKLYWQQWLLSFAQAAASISLLLRCLLKGERSQTSAKSSMHSFFQNALFSLPAPRHMLLIEATHSGALRGRMNTWMHIKRNLSLGVGGVLIHFVFARNFQRCQIKGLNFCGALKLKCSEISEDFFFFYTLKMWEVGRKPSLLLVIFKPKMLLSCRFLVDVQRNICSWGSCLDYYCATLLMPVMTAEWISWSMSALEIRWHSPVWGLVSHRLHM